MASITFIMAETTAAPVAGGPIPPAVWREDGGVNAGKPEVRNRIRKEVRR